MSVEGEVDLDAMIENDKKQAKIKKTKEIEKQKELRWENRRKGEEGSYARKLVDVIAKQKELEKHRTKAREQRRIKDQQRQQRKQASKPPNFSEKPCYAISITGLVSDISIDDICKLMGERKIISVKTMLRNKDRSPLDTANASLMSATVVLAEKEEADSFVKLYSDRKLDGKYELAFSFVDPNQELE